MTAAELLDHLGVLAGRAERARRRRRRARTRLVARLEHELRELLVRELRAPVGDDARSAWIAREVDWRIRRLAAVGLADLAERCSADGSYV